MFYFSHLLSEKRWEVCSPVCLKVPALYLTGQASNAPSFAHLLSEAHHFEMGQKQQTNCDPVTYSSDNS